MSSLPDQPTTPETGDQAPMCRPPGRCSPTEVSRLRCPHCQNVIVRTDDQAEVACTGCGGSFRIRDSFVTSENGQIRTLGRFQLLACVGRGAFGAVWRAHDLDLDRVVAIKIPHSGRLGDAEDRERFLREARAAAQLRHPGIVTVHQVAEQNGMLAIVSDFITGMTLRDLLKTRRLTFRESAELVACVAEALHYAHSVGLVHRDIKPANIMMEEGRPILLDFGLALREDVEITMTMDGQIIGTPAYMSPEQAAGQSHCVDARSDAYSLGVVLYELLCGELPFRGSKAMMVQQVMVEEPRPPRRLNDRIPHDLETICLKAMAKEAGGRYQTAGELTADLRRWLAGEPIRARPISKAARLWRWLKRNPRVAAQVAAALFILFVLGGIAREINRRTQARRLAQAILAATPAELKKLVADDLPYYRRWADPILQAESVDGSTNAARRLRASIALAPVDSSQQSDLFQRLLDCTVEEFPVIRDSLKDPSPSLRSRLWQVLRDPEQDERARFHAGMALAEFAPMSSDWTEQDAEFLAKQLIRSNPDDQLPLRLHLRRISKLLVPPLEVRFRDETAREGLREAAANALADFAADDPRRLAELVCDATPDQFHILFPVLAGSPEHCPAAAAVFRTVVQQLPGNRLATAEHIRLGKRRAGAAIALLRLGDRVSAFQVFQDLEDPEALSQFVHRAKDRGVKPEDLVDCLGRTTEERARFAILLALGEFSLGELPRARRSLLTQQLATWYGDDSSSGIHGAVGWVLRNWGLNEPADQVDRTAVPYEPNRDREWFVRKIDDDYFTFVVFQPGEFVMGSPETETSRDVDEGQHRVTFTRRFAMSDREVTLGQWRRFTQSMRAIRPNDDRASPTLDHSASACLWAHAVVYCRWLTRQAGMAEQDQCYVPKEGEVERFDLHPDLWEFHPERPGFRLPTEVEWEYACRAGTTTPFFFGSDLDLLPRYGWLLNNAGPSTHVGGMLRPNSRGLFDIVGNIFEWCHDGYADSFDDDLIDPVGPNTGHSRIFRGGAWNYDWRYCRSAARATPPSVRQTGFGFRVACSLPQK